MEEANRASTMLVARTLRGCYHMDSESSPQATISISGSSGDSWSSILELNRLAYLQSSNESPWMAISDARIPICFASICNRSSMERESVRRRYGDAVQSPLAGSCRVLHVVTVPCGGGESFEGGGRSAAGGANTHLACGSWRSSKRVLTNEPLQVIL